MTIVTRVRRLHRISHVNHRLKHLGSATGHNIQMIINDAEADKYLGMIGQDGYVDLLKFISSHGWAFKDPDIGQRARSILDQMGEDVPEMVTITLQVAEKDSHELMRIIQQYFEVA